MENNLPKGWEESSLEALASNVIGGDWGKDQPEPCYKKIYVLRGTDYKNWNNVRAQHAAIRYFKEQSIEKRQLVEGDIILEVSGGGPDQPVGRVVGIDRKALDSVAGKLSFSNFFRLIRIDRNMNPSFVKAYLDYAYSRGDFNEMQTHTTNLRNLRVSEFLSKTKVPIPPLPEQQRIVAKLDELMERIDRSRARLERIPKILKRFRQSLLSAAVSGKLTEEWRERNKVKATNEYDEFSKKSFKGNDGLPDEWSWITVEDYLVNCDKGRIPVSQEERKKRKGRFPYYGATGVIDDIDGYTHDGEFILLSEDGMNLIYRTKPQSIIAKGKIWVNNHAHVLKAREGFSNEYVVHCFNTIDITPYLTGIDQVKLTQKNLNSILLPIPPKEEQVEIVLRINQLFSLAGKIEARYNKAKSQLDRLPQSLLAKAFRGELAPQDESDEPASVLLRKISHHKTLRSVEKTRTKKYQIELPATIGIAAESKPTYIKSVAIEIPDNKRAFAKQVLGGKIVSLFKEDPQFTRIKFQKLQYLAEHLAEVDLNWNYYRQSAGPYDPKFMHTVAFKLKVSKWFEEKKYKFHPLEKADKIDGYYEGYFKPVATKLDSLFSALKESTEDEAEIVATIYAVWNNMIIKKERINDDVIVSTFFEWSDRKKKYTQPQVSKALVWMKKSGFVPTGFGRVIKEKKK